MAAVLKSVHASPASIVMCMSNSTSESQDEDSIHSQDDDSMSNSTSESQDEDSIHLQDDDSMSIVSRAHTVMLS
jgi:hypothetical protein